MNKKTIVIMFALVMTFGIIGLLQEGYAVQDAIFFTFIMFFGNYSDTTSNILVNIARYSALLVTTTTVLLFFADAFQYIKDSVASKYEDSIFVYGNNNYVDQFMKRNTSHIINGTRFKNASKYVLLADDKENLNFYYNNESKFKNKDVYIKNSTFFNTIDGNLHYFSLEQLAARRFYRNNAFVDLAFENGKPKEKLKITIVGNTPLSEAVLYESINVNIFDNNQKVYYQLIGSFDDFMKLHKNNKELGFNHVSLDAYDSIDVIEDSDAVLFFDSEDRLYKLLGSLNKGNIYFFCDIITNEEQFLKHCYGYNSSISLKIISNYDEILDKNEIIDEIGLNNAKLLNSNYNFNQGLYKGLSVNEQWNLLSSFHKTINISFSDFYIFTLVKLMEKITGKDYRCITIEDLNNNIDYLSKLEHIRWCNYHLYCNWSYNDKTVKELKKHNCLIPYDKLSKEEKDKDKEQIYSMFNIYK